MQLMTWPLARLGSRFALLFEPARRRVMHSALGRFLDEPLDLAVGLVESDGTERVMPFTAGGETFYATEHFERMNSITFRGYSERLGVRFELNFHSPFYPQNEQVSLLPVFYVELRVTGVDRLRLRKMPDPPEKVRLFIRLRRPHTQLAATDGRIDLNYDVPLEPRYQAACGSDRPDGSTEDEPADPAAGRARVTETLRSLNEGAAPTHDDHGGAGLTLDLPVTEEGSGVKWRLVWAAHTADPVLDYHGEPAPLRYVRYWRDLDAVVHEATTRRDENLALSRRFEKLLDQAPLNRSRWHLLVLAFHSYLANTFWCDLDEQRELFTVWEGNYMYHSTLDVAYNHALLYFAMWPRLLKLSLDNWARHYSEHESSGGVILWHDLGRGMRISRPAYDHAMPVEENSNFLLMLQAYAHWTGDTEPITDYAPLARRLAAYLLWTDRDQSGFPSEGSANTLDDAPPVVQMARKQAYLAIKRAMALEAAADLLSRADDMEMSERCRDTAASAVIRIERDAWLDDHYAVCIDRDKTALYDAETGEALPFGELTGWDDYSLHTANGLLLPSLIAQPLPFDQHRLQIDLLNAHRETLRAYGCAHTSSDSTNIWISQNLWRDFIARYLNIELTEIDTRYWDLLTYSNTHNQSFGYIDTYISNELAFNPRGATAFGWLLAGPRLAVDRLDGAFFAVNPDRQYPQRWPLLALADWEAGKIPVCVVDPEGQVFIEGEIEPVKILGEAPRDTDVIG